MESDHANAKRERLSERLHESVTRKNIYSSASKADGNNPEWVSPVKTGRDIDLTRWVRDYLSPHPSMPVHESPGKRGRVSLNTVD